MATGRKSKKSASRLSSSAKRPSKPAPRRPSRPVSKPRAAAKPAPKSASKAPARPAPKAPARDAPAKRAPSKPSGTSSTGVETGDPLAPRPSSRRHILSLSFLRDGDEFLARLETDAGHITELKNRSLDQLLTLVAGELEDLLE